jgi:ADP-ribose pyrophosphatase YjhB (NUDIX family)
VPSVNVVVTNANGDVLLIRRSDNQNWAVLGGAIDLGESMVQTAVRETKEETGIDCEITGLAGIYTDPKHVILYTGNGEARQECSIVLTARATGGAPTRSDESSQVRWVPRDDLDGYPMDRSMRLRGASWRRKERCSSAKKLPPKRRTCSRPRFAPRRHLADRLAYPVPRYDGVEAAFEISGDQDALRRPPGRRALTEFEPRHLALARLRSGRDPEDPEAAFIHAVPALAAGHGSEAGEAIARCAEASTSWERRTRAAHLTELTAIRPDLADALARFRSMMAASHKAEPHRGHDAGCQSQESSCRP